MRKLQILVLAGALLTGSILALPPTPASATTYKAKAKIQLGNGNCGRLGSYPTAGTITFKRTGNLVSYTWTMTKAQKSVLLFYSLWQNECEQDSLYGWGSFYTNSEGKTPKYSQTPQEVPAGATRFFVAFYDEATGEYDDSVAVTLP